MDSRTSFVVLFSIIFNVQVILHMQKQTWVYKQSNISWFTKVQSPVLYCVSLSLMNKIGGHPTHGYTTPSRKILK